MCVCLLFFCFFWGGGGGRGGGGLIGGGILYFLGVGMGYPVFIFNWGWWGIRFFSN